MQDGQIGVEFSPPFTNYCSDGGTLGGRVVEQHFDSTLPGRWLDDGWLEQPGACVSYR